MEGQERLELSTPCLRGRCSNQLSYWPTIDKKVLTQYSGAVRPRKVVRAPGALLYFSAVNASDRQLSYWPVTRAIIAYMSINVKCYDAKKLFVAGDW